MKIMKLFRTSSDSKYKISRILILMVAVLICSFIGTHAGKVSGMEYVGFFDSAKVDYLKRSSAKIQPGETLSTILLSHGVSHSVIHKLEGISKSIFDVRKIKAGNTYYIINGSGSVDLIQYLVYEHTLIDYVVFKLGDPVDVYKGKKKVDIKKRIASGKIESSLFDALADEKFTHELTLKLSELYAYVIDLHHLQKGDYFKVVYEEQNIGNEPAALGKILAACFGHRGYEFYGFYFEQGGKGRYYDQNGNSMEKSLLKSPLKYTRITSHYSPKRLHPILNCYTPHLGVDFAAPEGTPIMSVGDGRVKEALYHGELGNYVTIRHNGIYSTQYLHMSKIKEGIRPGVSVRQGDVIGYVGRTGLATGPHVEYRLWKNGKSVNPLKEEIPSADPIKKEYVDAFQRQLAKFKNSLDRIQLSDLLVNKRMAKH